MAPYSWPYLNLTHPLWRGCVFAGVGPKVGNGNYLYDMMDQANGNNGTLTNMEPATDWVWVPELGRFGCSYDGSDEYVAMQDSAAIKTITNQFTMSLWAYERGTTTTNHYWTKAYTSADPPYYEFALYKGTDSVATFAVDSGGSFKFTESADNAVVASTWIHWCCRWDGANLQIYKNGVATGTPTATSTAMTHYATTPCIAARKFGAAAASGHSNCIISDTLLYARALSLSEIQQLADPSNVTLNGAVNR